MRGRSRSSVTAGAACALLVLGPVTPALAGQATPPAPSVGTTTGEQRAPLVLTSRETVQANLDASGSQTDTRLYAQLTVQGSGRYRIVDPTSTEELRDLSGFRAPETHAGAAVWDVHVDGVTHRRTVADYTRTLPVGVRVTYELNGQRVTPDELVGRSGQLRVTYDVHNLTTRPTRLTLDDGTGRVVHETVDVATPYVGQLETTLPSAFTHVSAPRGDVSADGHGGSRVSWSLVLFGPVGEERQQLTYTASVTDIEIPPAEAEFVPVPPQRQPEFRYGQEGFSAGIDTGRHVTDDMQQLHLSVLQLHAEASTVLSGLSGLQQQATGLGTRFQGLRQQVTGLSGQLGTGLSPEAQSVAARALQVEAEARALSLLVSSEYEAQALRLAGAARQLALDARGVADSAGQADSAADALSQDLGTTAGDLSGLASRLGGVGASQRQLVAGASAMSAQGLPGLLGNSQAAVRNSSLNLAIMQELNRRAAESGQPYGPPAGSVADSAAYVYNLAGATHDPVDNRRRGLVAGGMLVLGTLVATLARHRVVPWPRRGAPRGGRS